MRSTIQTYKTGAVIFDRRGEIVSWGTSHDSFYSAIQDKRSVHAEDDALNRIKFIKDKSDLSIVVYTLNWNYSRVVSSSRPCLGCSERLLRANLRHVFYLQRDNVGSWLINRTKPVDLIESIA